MNSNHVDIFLMTNAKYFESHHLSYIRERLILLDDSKSHLIQTLTFKDPTIVLIVSLLAGPLGVDRFVIGDTGLGLAKLFTCGGLGIWTIIDWFLIMKATKEKNMQSLQRFLY